MEIFTGPVWNNQVFRGNNYLDLTIESFEGKNRQCRFTVSEKNHKVLENLLMALNDHRSSFVTVVVSKYTGSASRWNRPPYNAKCVIVEGVTFENKATGS